jgi:hypothetical protein
VKLAAQESPTIEYKGQMADTIARGVAALADAYGGCCGSVSRTTGSLGESKIRPSS